MSEVQTESLAERKAFYEAHLEGLDPESEEYAEVEGYIAQIDAQLGIEESEASEELSEFEVPGDEEPAVVEPAPEPVEADAPAVVDPGAAPDEGALGAA